MKSLQRYLYSRRLVLVICLIYLFIRMFALDQLFLSRDERDLSMTAYSISKTGKDLFGHKLPITFERISPNAPALSVYYGVLWWLMPIEKNVFNARLAFVLPTTLLPLLIFELIYFMTRRKRLSIVTALVFSLSPWIFHISRMALEINLALPLILLALNFQLRKHYSLSLVFYVLTFFTYQGFRPMAFVLPVYFEIYFYFHEKGSLKRLFTMLTGITMIFLFLITLSIVVETGIQSRSTNEIVFLNETKLDQEVEFMNKISSAPEFLKPIYNNKTVAVVKYLGNNLLKGMDFSYLFFTGDYDPQYANGVAGQFISVLMPFLVLGTFFLRRKALPYFFLAGLTALGLIPSLINSYSLTFSIRSALSAIGFSFLMSLGLMDGYWHLDRISKISKKLIIFLVCLVFIAQTTSFFYGYYGDRYGLYSESFAESDRQLSKYLGTTDKKYTIFSPLPYQTLMSHVFLVSTEKKDLKYLNEMLTDKFDNFTYLGNTFKSCESIGEFIPEKAKKTIINDVCVAGNKDPQIMKNVKPKTLPYSSYLPYDHEVKAAYFIFE